ncbi:hypothetical protein OIN60_12715 [Paenibacillus sp. P96]|uniref:Uncharacterized protein n=1 Tax=Paenibacillus zeirhizosphaerae TaxID=2987519 RepID=A0ABT9FSD2_9BACL|nr:hypothetical protein [Paenibacillus sp. P96]MDP4097635.1 hypothetical protein [Paenibacillus sp. P96]
MEEKIWRFKTHEGHHEEVVVRASEIRSVYDLLARLRGDESTMTRTEHVSVENCHLKVVEDTLMNTCTS